VGLASGLDALTLALKALGVGIGDEVIVPANTYIATVLSVTAVGATPVFVEPDEYYCIDANKIENAITPNTKAVIPVHLYGQSCEMHKIIEISQKYRIYIVEDCAQSHGAKYGERVTGTFGDIGCFSFYPTKNLGAFGDAGAIVTNDASLARKIKMLRNYGSEQKYNNEIIGVNSRLDEIQAALLRVKLKYVEELTDERRKIANFYLDNIRAENVFLPRVRTQSTHCWHLFVIRSSQRDSIQTKLEKNGIATQIHYPIPPYLSNAYACLGYRSCDFPIAGNYADTVLSLPLYNGMPFEFVERVVEVIGRD
jgi:dTDP-4-amino-4,6-dideoxygalactose transaminase